MTPIHETRRATVIRVSSSLAGSNDPRPTRAGASSLAPARFSCGVRV